MNFTQKKNKATNLVWIVLSFFFKALIISLNAFWFSSNNDYKMKSLKWINFFNLKGLSNISQCIKIMLLLVGLSGSESGIRNPLNSRRRDHHMHFGSLLNICLLCLTPHAPATVFRQSLLIWNTHELLHYKLINGPRKVFGA